MMSESMSFKCMCKHTLIKCYVLLFLLLLLFVGFKFFKFGLSFNYTNQVCRSHHLQLVLLIQHHVQIKRGRSSQRQKLLCV